MTPSNDAIPDHSKSTESQPALTLDYRTPGHKTGPAWGMPISLMAIAAALWMSGQFIQWRFDRNNPTAMKSAQPAVSLLGSPVVLRSRADNIAFGIVAVTFISFIAALLYCRKPFWIAFLVCASILCLQALAAGFG